MKFAAIDIGSNAARLLLSNVFEDGEKVSFKKSSLIRVPLRLGFDAFSQKQISEKKIQKLSATMQAFKTLIDVHEVISWKAIATAAMREAENGAEIVERVFQETGVNIEIVSGEQEASIVYSNHIAESLDPNKSYLYIDVGGGSTEVTLFADRQVCASYSFNIGTIRLINNQVTDADWKFLKGFVKEVSKNHQPLIGIGSGGNINKLFKMSGKQEGKPLPTKKLQKLRDSISELTVSERITQLGMNEDRADVIVHAANIFLFILKHADIKKILVPEIGVSDGIIHLLYEEYKSQRS
ncbi:MAG: ethanolamine ammonia-lyase reactivating factor EutA [Bacteroidia bacterium]|nr:ethanolamine ammonia-lyase reactivating factor EutA [Bacteroidia bacterium]